MKDKRVLHDLGIDIENGIIPLIGEVGEEMYARLVHCITAINNTKTKYDEITILLNTYGGDLYQAFAIYDLLRSQDKVVNIVCNGPVMSAGTIILLAGDTRAMTPMSHLMYHYGQDAAESEQELKQNVKLLKIMKKLYKKNSKVTARVLNKWFSQNTYYDAEEALKVGLIDEVLSSEQEEKAPSKKR